MNLYPDCEVRVDNNQLQDQACDPFVMIEQGFKSNLISKIYPGNSYLTSQCFIIEISWPFVPIFILHKQNLGVLLCYFNPRTYMLTLTPIVV